MITKIYSMKKILISDFTYFKDTYSGFMEILKSEKLYGELFYV